jgi:transcriptional regulator with XRE-family HTH domain
MTLSPEVKHYRDADVFHAGYRIRAARELAGYADTSAFAEALDYHRSSIAKYEKTGIIPRRRTLKEIAIATGVRLEWLETGTGPMYNEPDPGGVTRAYLPLRKPQKPGGKVTSIRGYRAAPAHFKTAA